MEVARLSKYLNKGREKARTVNTLRTFRNLIIMASLSWILFYSSYNGVFTSLDSSTDCQKVWKRPFLLPFGRRASGFTTALLSLTHRVIITTSDVDYIKSKSSSVLRRLYTVSRNLRLRAWPSHSLMNVQTTIYIRKISTNLKLLKKCNKTWI